MQYSPLCTMYIEPFRAHVTQIFHYVSMYVCLYVCIYVCVYVCIYVCMFVCFYICMYCIVCMYVTALYVAYICMPCLYPCVHMYVLYVRIVRMYVCMHVCMCMFTAQYYVHRHLAHIIVQYSPLWWLTYIEPNCTRDTNFTCTYDMHPLYIFMFSAFLDNTRLSNGTNWITKSEPLNIEYYSRYKCILHLSKEKIQKCWYSANCPSYKLA